MNGTEQSHPGDRCPRRGLPFYNIAHRDLSHCLTTNVRPASHVQNGPVEGHLLVQARPSAQEKKKSSSNRCPPTVTLAALGNGSALARIGCDEATIIRKPPSTQSQQTRLLGLAEAAVLSPL
ncbi:hypothetical protein THAOC_16372 [Thalassiosira oceanica]|uniref:Uncharacterized protein n=1 Tax=Thalassiosira oceanica TaxID=159749 RepID=K0SXK8_THAOC|nr:hypothetical protein THAOC_16372 [Thalassiosira oceanica]|eukprot:EJK62997.1 hypothetical protein THAOC_16372 [Thalassiosira oceanica]